MDERIVSTYDRWLRLAEVADSRALEGLKAEPGELADAFSRDLSFGTGGLRGLMGLGPNRLNVYTVGRATQGLANWLLADCSAVGTSVAIAYDSRNHSAEFARRAASVLAGNGIHALVFPHLEPTPVLSYAVRRLGCAAGIVLTASHNPKEYNGYKVYGPDGCQATTEACRSIQGAILKVDPFDDVRALPFETALDAGAVSWIDDELLDGYVNATVSCRARQDLSNLSVVYTPLNGTGAEPVARVLREAGVTDFAVVPEQAEANGDFPTCPKPNPEERAALELAVALGERRGADLVLATDPDADRVGVAVLHEGSYELLTGNEVGLLLLDWLARRSRRSGSVAMTTIVSAPMADDLARAHGIELRRTLTGFKFIGEQIGLLEGEGREDDFLMGFEESYGYLAGTHVRDKDAMISCLLICELAAEAKERGSDLYVDMRRLYDDYGHWGNEQVSIRYAGADGPERMAALMAGLRTQPPASLAGLGVERMIDYLAGAEMPVVNPRPDEGVQTLPASNVLEFRLTGGSRALVRPSGTEPKVKGYVFAKASTQDAAERLQTRLVSDLRTLLNGNE